MKKTLLALACCAAALAAAPAFADDPLPVINIPKASCTKPDSLPRVEPTRSQQARFKEQLGVYQTCITTYIERQKELSKIYAKASNDAVDAGNAAAGEFNDFAKANSNAAPDDDK